MTYAGDRLRAAIEAVVRAMMPSELLSGSWPGVVTTWDDDRQRAEIAMDAGSPLPRTLRGVPALVDPPGTKVQLTNGTRVLVAFRGSSPAAPYCRPAAHWGEPSVPLPTVGLAGGGPAVVRVGDPVGAGLLALVPMPLPAPPGTMGLAYTPRGAIVATIVATFPPGVAVPGQATELAGAVTSGSSRVTCG